MFRQLTKRKRHAIFYFPEDRMTEVRQTSFIVEGVAKEGETISLYWDSKNPDVPAKVTKLSGEYTLLVRPLLILILTKRVLVFPVADKW